MASKSPGDEQKTHDGNNQVTALVDKGASSNYFDDQLILQLKQQHHLLDRVILTVPRKILTAGGSLLNGTAEGLLQDVVADEHGNPHLVRVGIMNVSEIGSTICSVKAAVRKGGDVKKKGYVAFSLSALRNMMYCVRLQGT